MTFSELTEYLQTRFGADAFGVETANYQPYLTVSADKLVELCQFLRDDEPLFFDLLACITAIDNGVGVNSPEKDTMDVIYNLTSIPHEHNLMLRVTVPRHTGTTTLPTLPSLTHLWRTADWHEREAYDLLGIYFDKHPDLRRILLPTDWIGHPLRTDYEEPEQYHGIKTK